MDILERAFLMVQAELGPEIFNNSTRLKLSLKLRQQEGGDRHYIASTAALEYQARRETVRKLASSGVSNSEIAQRIGITPTSVRRYLAIEHVLP